jgi:hypothetical protein
MRQAVIAKRQAATRSDRLLPKSKEITASPWQTYRETQQTFDLIVPGVTTAEDLRASRSRCPIWTTACRNA